MHSKRATKSTHTFDHLNNVEIVDQNLHAKATN